MKRAARLVWLAMLAGQVIVAILLPYLGSLAGAAGPPALLGPAFAVAALVLALAAVLAWRHASGEAVAVNRLLAERPAGRERRVALYVVAWALDETVTVLGLVLVLLGGAVATGLAFAAAGILLTALHRPAPS